jgi:hypothetical protein
MYFKITWRFYLTPVRMVMTREKKATNAGKDAEDKGPLYTVNR